MKGKTKILFHYLFLVVCVSMLLLFVNFCVLVGWSISAAASGNYYVSISKLSEGLTKNPAQPNTFSLSPELTKALDTHYAWGMLLDEEGHVIWNYKLPDSIPLNYTASDIAGFSKWYLQDYPVETWSTDYGLLVLADFPHTLWKKQLFFPEHALRKLPTWLISGLIADIFLAILLILLFSLRSFRSLSKVLSGIEALGVKKPVSLETKGLFKELACNINTASNELLRQQRLIEKRDTARNNWIAAVSHDIRTPLSMIMGYSSALENNPHFSEEDQQKLGIIRLQSERIKSLVNDLNLTTKLEYEMQPLNMAPFYMPQLLRKIVVNYLNSFTDDRFSLDLDIAEDCQRYELNGNANLFERALHNLIGNSLGHNDSGCHITITLTMHVDGYHLDIQDNGSGFPDATLEKLNATSELPVGATHGLGLFIVKQIVEVHKGQIHFGNLFSKQATESSNKPLEPLGCLISIVLPFPEQPEA